MFFSGWAPPTWTAPHPRPDAHDGILADWNSGQGNWGEVDGLVWIPLGQDKRDQKGTSRLQAIMFPQPEFGSG